MRTWGGDQEVGICESGEEGSRRRGHMRTWGGDQEETGICERGGRGQAEADVHIWLKI